MCRNPPLIITEQTIAVPAQLWRFTRLNRPVPLTAGDEFVIVPGFAPRDDTEEHPKPPTKKGPGWSPTPSKRQAPFAG